MTVNEAIKELEKIRDAGYGDYNLKVSDTYSICEINDIGIEAESTSEVLIYGQNFINLICGLDDEIFKYDQAGRRGILQFPKEIPDNGIYS